MSDPMPRIAGRYRLEDRLSSLGVGAVWTATDERSGQPVAVRFLERGADDPDRVALFRASAYAAARLRHPFIARVLDEGVDEVGGAFIVTEWVGGTPLSDWVGSRPPWGFVKAVLTRVCDALAYVHAKGLVHLDLRPGTIRVLQGPDGPDVRLLGVGVTRLDAGDGDRQPGARLTLQYQGSLRYVAPEVAERPPWSVGPWSDLYSLGLVLWELLCGDIPHGDQKGVGLMLARQDPLSPGLPAGAGDDHHGLFARLLDRLLQREPEARPRSAAQVGLTLAAVPGAPQWVDPLPRARPTRPAFAPYAWATGGFPLAALAPAQLVERDPAIEQVWSAIDATAQGHGSRLVVVEGPAATAKSALVSFVTDHAQVRGITRLLTVRFAPGEAPGSGLSGALRRLFRVGPADLAGIRERVNGLSRPLGLTDRDLKRVLPPLLSPDTSPFSRPPNALEPAWHGGGFGATSMLSGAFTAVVRHLAEREPLVLWLDDVHWAPDEEGVDVVEAALADAEHPVCVVVTARRGHPSTAEWARRFPPGALVTWVPVEPMSAAGVAAYIQHRIAPEPETARRVAAFAAGSPGALPELVDWLLDGRLVRTFQGATLAPGVLLPEHPDELRRAIFRQLPAEGAEVLVPDVVAGLARAQVPLTAEVIAALEEVDPHRPYRAALFEAERGRWLVRDALGGWAFTRPELADWLARHQRARAESWHKRWARALRRLEGQARGRYGLERAWHAEQLGETPAALSALLDAAAWALGPAQPSVRRGVLAAHRAQDLADSLNRPLDASRAARLKAELYRRRGQIDEATTALLEAEDRLEAGAHPVARGWCRQVAGWLYLDRQRFEDARQAFSDAGPLCAQGGDDGGVQWALLGEGHVELALGNATLARRLGKATELAFDQLDAARGGLAARFLRAAAAAAGGDAVTADKRYEGLQTLADDRGWWVEAVLLRLRRAELALTLSRPHDAERHLAEAGRLASILGLHPVTAWVRAVRPPVLAAAGEGLKAREALAAAVLPAPALAHAAREAARKALSLPGARLDPDLFTLLTHWADQLDAHAGR
ncbi:MAG: AAA family ATPase [Myxococcales bacterium]|nr:AAA family ATPase [Myxococcales bacterium]